MSDRHMEKRFGIIAVEKGFISPAQVIEALESQVMEEMEGKPHRLIGTILVEMGYMTNAQVRDVLKSMDIPV